MIILPFMEISVNPIGTQTPSFSQYVSKACQVVEKHGLQYQITPTCTVVEGDIDELFSLAKQIHSLPLESGADRVVTNITIDQRTDKKESYADSIRAAAHPGDR